VLKGAPALSEQREAAFPQGAQRVEHGIAGCRCNIEFVADARLLDTRLGSSQCASQLARMIVARAWRRSGHPLNEERPRLMFEPGSLTCDFNGGERGDLNPRHPGPQICSCIDPHA